MLDNKIKAKQRLSDAKAWQAVAEYYQGRISNTNPSMAKVVCASSALAAIAAADSICLLKLQKSNSGEHAGAVKMLRQATQDKSLADDFDELIKKKTKYSYHADTNPIKEKDVISHLRKSKKLIQAAQKANLD